MRDVAPARQARRSAGHYRQQYESASSERAREPEWIGELRAEAMDRFDALGFPLPSDEEWRFTPIGPIAETLFMAAPRGHAVREDAAQRDAFYDLASARVVLANGRLVAEFSSLAALHHGAAVSDLATALRRMPDPVHRHLGRIAEGGPSLSSLNMALMGDCVVVTVPDGVEVPVPIEVLHIATPASEPYAAYPRVLLVAGRGSSVTLIERYAHDDGESYWTDAVTELAVEDGASVEHYRLQHETWTAYHTGRTAVRLGRDSRYTSQVVHTGSAIARHDLDVVLAGEGGVCTLNGLYLGRGRQLMDNHTVIDHAVPNCESHEMYKGILNDRAHGVFNGKVYVRRDAQKTNAKQSNQALLLSDAAHVDTKPQLEIFADDVRCTHGATVGQLDADALFYLRSRGIALEDARSVLVHAFASDVIDRMSIPQVRARLEEMLLATLPRPSSVFG